MGARVLILAAAVAGHTVLAASSESSSRVLERFFATAHATPDQFRALRHFEAHTEKLDKTAWMEAWTEADASGFRYEITGEGGSGVIRSRIFREVLETEQKMWEQGGGDRSAINRDNYVFADCAERNAELACVNLKPRRKEVMLFEGAIFLDPDSGDLVRVEGSLSKNPSFWTRKVDILRRYERIGGVRMPVAVESFADIRMAGQSTLTITYEYESVNGVRVGSPTARRQPSPEWQVARGR